MLYQNKLESYEYMSVLKQYKENWAQELIKHTKLSKVCRILSWTP